MLCSDVASVWAKRAAAALALGTSLLTLGGAIAADQVKVQINGSDRSFPESMTSTADGTLYAGSTADGIVYKAAPGAATAEAWTAKQDGPQNMLGVLADEKNNTLWACYSGQDQTLVRSFDLKTAQATGSYDFPGGGLCNDIAVGPDNSVYISDTRGNRILRLKSGATALDEWLKDDAKLKGVDGLSFSADGKLYVNSVTEGTLMRIDMSPTGDAAGVVAISTSTPLQGPDGMRFGDDGKLYIAENRGGQVDVATLNGDNAEITVLQSGLMNPTAVSKVGDTLWALEAKQALRKSGEDPKGFFMYAIDLAAAQ